MLETLDCIRVRITRRCGEQQHLAPANAQAGPPGVSISAEQRVGCDHVLQMLDGQFQHISF